MELVNTVIDKIKKDGTLDGIIAKYFSGKESEYVKVPSGVENAEKKQLIVATHTPFSPFEFSRYEIGKGKLYSGIDIEIAYLIAQELDAELVIKDMAFEDVLGAVRDQKADIAMAGLTAYEGREELVTFSSTYYEASQVLIVKGDDETFDGCKTKEDVEAVLKSMNSDISVGFQEDTTSQYYIEGKDTLGFGGYSVTPCAYASPILAAQALISGKVDFVIADEAAAGFIVADMNK